MPELVQFKSLAVGDKFRVSGSETVYQKQKDSYPGGRHVNAASVPTRSQNVTVSMHVSVEKNLNVIRCF